MKRSIIILGLVAVSVIEALTQPQKSYTSSEIYLKLEKLNVLANVLYVAAHPDDENTRMITYLENGALVSAAYLSMTRGDGGQNLIGPEIREQLGVIRTQELLAARRRDGGDQYFTRANDFGYSKTTEETQKLWNREEVLADVVWTYRNFRPDVIITRFPGDGRGGHGHHTTSAILAQEAFNLSGKKSAYPDQLKYVQPWQPIRIFTNTGRWWNSSISKEDEGVVMVDVGEYNALLGQSYTEIAAVSRSQHKSQGFGATGSRGIQEEFLEFVDGSQVDYNIFDGIDITWNRVSSGAHISALVEGIIDSFIVENPEKSIPALMSLRKEISELGDPFWVSRKIDEIDELIRMCSGIYLEAVSPKYMVVPGDSIDVQIEVTNRSGIKSTLKSISVESTTSDYNLNLNENNSELVSLRFQVPGEKQTSGPYWLKEQGTLGMYKVDEQMMIGKPENDPAIQAHIAIQINENIIHYGIPVEYKWNDRVKGEQRRRLEVVPPVMISIPNSVVIFPTSDPKSLDVKITAGKDGITPTVKLNLPDGWRSEPDYRNVTLDQPGDELITTFMVYPPVDQDEHQIVASATLDGKEYTKGLTTISYDHIPIQTLLPEAKSKLVRLNIKKHGSVIGYVMGAGDEVPSSLEQIGYTVWQMNLNDITPENLAGLDAVIMGIRAINTYPELKNHKGTLLHYVDSGGTLVYQYNTTRRINWEDFAPYEIGFSGGSRDSRVSVEEADVAVLKPTSPLLSTPNKISSKDFDGWVQERGLYFPNTWAPEYEAILSSHDPNEEAKDGGLLVAKYGKGYFVYTGYAWFRQLPAGVPGAYRLFANIISLGKEDKPNNTVLNPENK